jgi:hypothetical protein
MAKDITASRWLPVFREFVRDVRISSKEQVSEDDRGVALELWDSQERFLQEISSGLDRGIHTFMCLKSRQLGITTISLLIDLLWLAMHRGMTCALVTENETNRDSNRGILRQYVNSFPENYFGESFKIVKGGDNRSFMKFSNGSRIDFLVAGTKEKGTAWGQGRGYAFAHLTEVGSYGSSDGLSSFEEAFAQSNPNRLFIYEGTANGFNHWCDRWKAAKADMFTQHAFFIGFWANNMNRISRSDARFARFGIQEPDGEEREKIAEVASLYNHKITPEQLAWYRWRKDKDEKEGGDGQMLDQNQPFTETDAFIQSGYSFFAVRQLSKDMKTMDDAPPAPVKEGGFGWRGYRYEMGERFFDMRMVEEMEDIGRVELRIWEEPQADGRYVIGFDPAYGRNDHKDNSCISIWRGFADKLVQVAEYATSEHDIKQASWILAHLAAAYDNSIVNYEVNGPGNFVSLEWDSVRGQLNAEMNQTAVKERNWENAMSNARWYLYARPDSGGRPTAKGFSTTFNNKVTLMHGFRGSYATSELVIRSKKMLQEMVNVVQDGSTIGAPESRSENGKDDRVFAAAFAHRAWFEWVRPGMLMEGLTFAGVTAIEDGTKSLQGKRLESQVMRFLQTAEQAANTPPSPPKWKQDLGLA